MHQLADHRVDRQDDSVVTAPAMDAACFVQSIQFFLYFMINSFILHTALLLCQKSDVACVLPGRVL